MVCARPIAYSRPVFIATPDVTPLKRAAYGWKLGKKSAQGRGWEVTELVVIGFSEKHRALEVLPQLQRLKFEWCTDLDEAVAVEVERDGKLRLLHSDLLDPAAGWKEANRWRALLGAIAPLPHVPASSKQALASEVRSINAEGSAWLKDFALDQEFVRDTAALLRPGNSAIFAMLREFTPALRVLWEYSPFVLHTTVARVDVTDGS